MSVDEILDHFIIDIEKLILVEEYFRTDRNESIINVELVQNIEDDFMANQESMKNDIDIVEKKCMETKLYIDEIILY